MVFVSIVKLLFQLLKNLHSHVQHEGRYRYEGGYRYEAVRAMRAGTDTKLSIGMRVGRNTRKGNEIVMIDDNSSK